MNKIRIVIFSLLILLLIICFVFFLFPQIVFGKKIEYKSFIIYSHSQVDKNIFVVLDRAESLIDSSELNNFKPELFKIYLCNSFLEYFFFAPTQRHAFACNNPLTGNILISKSDISQNLVERNDPENNFRSLSGTIAHELTHSLIKEYVGFFRYMQLDTWINEGYADFIAKESSFNFQKGLALLCKHENSSKTSFRYFKYRLYIEYLIKDKKIAGNQILAGNFSLTKLDKEIYQKYCP